jgi:polyphosphate kinase
MPKTPPITNDSKMKRKEYEKELHKLQAELCYLQDWIKAAGTRVIVVFEGRDAAGKGGTIKAITGRVSPRVFRVAALPAPSDREKTQMFLQRYIERFPAGGEIVIFDRSWYNRAGVEKVMGFVNEKEAERFLGICPEIEKYITDAGIILLFGGSKSSGPAQPTDCTGRAGDVRRIRGRAYRSLRLATRPQRPTGSRLSRCRERLRGRAT